MSCYISSNDNRFYVEKEDAYGQVPAISPEHRIPAVSLTARQVVERPDRRDKTGSRTYFGTPTGARKQTSFELATYLTTWMSQDQAPGYAPLLQAAMGAEPKVFAGGTIASVQSSTRISFSTSHGLGIGQGIAVGGELRFVAAIVNSSAVELNAPFDSEVGSGSVATRTATYTLSSDLPSVSIFDYWSPAAAVQRVLCGSAVDSLEVLVNGDFHEFRFRGPASDLIDSSSFGEGQGGMTEYPVEPDSSNFDYSIIPGHLGQVWLGSTPERFYTLTSAQLKISNAIETRSREFGLEGPRCITPGQRTVSLNMSLFQQDDSATRSLYEAARQGAAISAMFQLGQRPGQLFGAYLKTVVPNVPEFDDSESRLQWKFVECRAQGSVDDEVVIAVG